MKVVVTMDSFKGSLSSMEAGNAIRQGILRAVPHASVVVRPLADGGEGTVEALTEGMGGRQEKIEVTGPLGNPVVCTYGILEQKKTAIIEMSGAAGLLLVEEARRNPLNTTTYGVGEVIKDAIQKGCRHFIVGIGGSATNDGGIGMLQALGYGMLDATGAQVPFGAKGLEVLQRVTTEAVLPELEECTFRVACDVTNPLCGESGCSKVFGPQKGADSRMAEKMDRWMEHYGKITSGINKKADVWHPGSGAAGGLGFAFLSYTNAVLESGIQIVLEETGLEKEIQDAALVVTGEGKLDGQTIFGKAPIGVAKLAKKAGKPVIAFSGAVDREAGLCNSHGIDAFFPVLRRVQTLEEAMDPGNAKEHTAAAAEQVFRLIALYEKTAKMNEM